MISKDMGLLIRSQLRSPVFGFLAILLCACSGSSGSSSDPSGIVSPTFAGLTQVEARNSGSVDLFWQAAQDPATPASQITYLIYQGSNSTLSFTKPNYTTVGATTYTVNQLTPGATYWFAVLAQDSAGNRSSPASSKEMEVTLPAFTQACIGGSQATPLSTNSVAHPAISSLGNSPVIAWDEPDPSSGLRRIHIKQCSSQKWSDMDTSGLVIVNPADHQTTPAIAASGNTLFVAWLEGGALDGNFNPADAILYVNRWNGTQWDTPINLLSGKMYAALRPTIDASAGNPVVAWDSNSGAPARQIFLKNWSGQGWTASDWTLIGSNGDNGLNVTPSDEAAAPALTRDSNTTYVTWKEHVCTQSCSSPTPTIIVQVFAVSCTLSSATCTTLPPTTPAQPLNTDPTQSAFFPIITLAGGTPFVGWYETCGNNPPCDGGYDVWVKSFTQGTGWTPVGNHLNTTFTLQDVDLRAISTTVYAAWSEFAVNTNHRMINIEHWDGAAWQLDNIANASSSADAVSPVLADVSNSLVVAWLETVLPQNAGGASSPNQLFAIQN